MTPDVNHAADSQEWGEGRVLPEFLTDRGKHEPLVVDLSQLRAYRSILIVGGTFDPFTRAHLEVPEEVRQSIGAEAKLYIPAWQNPLKANQAQGGSRERLAMIRESVLSEPDTYVSPLELLRGEPSFTAVTLREIRSALGEDIRLFLFLGSDCIRTLPSWKYLDEVMELAVVVPVARGEEPEAVLSGLEGRLRPEYIERLRQWFLTPLSSEISATAVREALAHGEIPWKMIPPAVGKYIVEHSLYGYAPG